MKFPRARAGQDFRQVAFGDAAPRHDNDPSTSPLHERNNRVQSFKRRPLQPGREHSLNPQPDQLIKCSFGITNHVKRAMEGDWQWVGQRDQFSRPGAINRAIRGEHPEHNHVGAGSFDSQKVTPHYLKLVVRIAKVRPARANHNGHGEFHPFANRLHEPEAGSQPALA